MRKTIFLIILFIITNSIYTQNNNGAIDSASISQWTFLAQKPEIENKQKALDSVSTIIAKVSKDDTNIIGILEYLGGSGTVSQIISTNGGYTIRAESVRMLAAIGGGKARDSIIKILLNENKDKNGGNSYVYSTCFLSLSKLGDDDNYKVSIAIVTAYNQIGSKKDNERVLLDFISAVRQLSKDKSLAIDVKIGFARAIYELTDDKNNTSHVVKDAKKCMTEMMANEV